MKFMTRVSGPNGGEEPSAGERRYQRRAEYKESEAADK